jgi:PAS domain S-box-containing protein
VREGFIAGANDPDDIDGMIMLFRRFREMPFMNDAIAIWAEGDERIADLDALAEELHAAIVAADAQPGTLAPILARIREVNRRLTSLAVRFSNTLGEASRQTQAILEVVLALTALLLASGGIGLAWRMLRAGDALGEALRVSEERFEVAVAGSNAGIWDWNVRTDEVYYSPRYKELLGYAGSEFTDDIKSFLDHLHPDERAVKIAALTAHLTSGAVYDDEIRLRTRSGEYRWFQARGKSVHDALGSATRMAGSITDITDRKQAEAQLFAERDRAQVTLESIGDAVITTDEAGRVEYLNPVAEILTGVPAIGARGLPLERVLRIVKETDRQVPVNPTAELRRGARTVKLGGDTSRSMRRPLRSGIARPGSSARCWC